MKTTHKHKARVEEALSLKATDGLMAILLSMVRQEIRVTASEVDARAFEVVHLQRACARKARRISRLLRENAELRSRLKALTPNGDIALSNVSQPGIAEMMAAAAAGPNGRHS